MFLIDKNVDAIQNVDKTFIDYFLMKMDNLGQT